MMAPVRPGFVERVATVRRNVTAARRAFKKRVRRAPMRVLFPLTLMLCACGPKELRVTMKSDNNSGQTGFALLSFLGDELTVTVETSVPFDGAGPQQAHIHTGTCGEIGGIVAGLTPLESNGATPEVFQSVTDKVPKPTLEELADGDYAINAHDASDVTVWVSCGEIPKP